MKCTLNVMPFFTIYSTMTSTMIVPERDTPCSQWVSFNGDNEPVLNTSPEVDEGCDTFLKRLQRTKVINQNGMVDIL
jgi:hypothetical protein